MDSDKPKDSDQQPETPQQSDGNGMATGDQPPSPRDAATSSKRPCPEGAQATTTQNSNPFPGFMVPREYFRILL